VYAQLRESPGVLAEFPLTENEGHESALHVTSRCGHWAPMVTATAVSSRRRITRCGRRLRGRSLMQRRSMPSSGGG
jgi:hypothetical protein